MIGIQREQIVYVTGDIEKWKIPGYREALNATEKVRVENAYALFLKTAGCGKDVQQAVISLLAKHACDVAEIVATTPPKDLEAVLAREAIFGDERIHQLLGDAKYKNMDAFAKRMEITTMASKWNFLLPPAAQVEPSVTEKVAEQLAQEYAKVGILPGLSPALAPATPPALVKKYLYSIDLAHQRAQAALNATLTVEQLAALK
jgi:hypothetical protein